MIHPFRGLTGECGEDLLSGVLSEIGTPTRAPPSSLINEIKVSLDQSRELGF